MLFRLLTVALSVRSAYNRVGSQIQMRKYADRRIRDTMGTHYNHHHTVTLHQK